jgi:DNA-directed RNA polymerase omega subunit
MTMENIPRRIDSKFRFVLLAAQRAEQMMRGASPKVELPNRKHSRVAMEEILREEIEWDYGPAPVPEAPAGEGEAGEELAAGAAQEE